MEGQRVGLAPQHPQRVSVRADWVQCSLGSDGGVRHHCDLLALVCVVLSHIP